MPEQEVSELNKIAIHVETLNREVDNLNLKVRLIQITLGYLVALFTAMFVKFMFFT